MKRLLSSLLLFSACHASYDYQVSINVKSSPSTQSHVIINNNEVFCSCGQPPAMVMFLYGKPEYYCYLHIPEIEVVRTITPSDLDRILKSVHEHNHNGAA